MSEPLPEIRLRQNWWWIRPTASLLAAGVALGAAIYHRDRVNRAAQTYAAPRIRAAMPYVRRAVEDGRRAAAKRFPDFVSAPPEPAPPAPSFSKPLRMPSDARGGRAGAKGRKTDPAEDLRAHMDAPVIMPEKVVDPSLVDRQSAFAIMMFLGIACFFGVLAYVLLGVNDPRSRGT